MTIDNISLAQYIVGKLRKAVASGDIVDYNAANRASAYRNFIYPDAPKIEKILKNKNNFPRVSVETLSHSSINEVGMSCTNYEELATLKISVWTVRDLVCTVKTTTVETHTFTSGTTVYSLDNLPVSDIVEVYDNTRIFIKNTDYHLIDNDSDGIFDSIEWLQDTPSNGEDFMVSYVRKASGSELARIIAQDIHSYLGKNWRSWDERKIWSYTLVSSMPIPFDEPISIYRYEMQVRFNGIDIGQEI